MKVGSGINGEITFLDTLGIMSFLIGVQNLDLNITQEDAQYILTDIHKHLEKQDAKIDYIIKELEVLKDGTERDL